MMLTSLVENAIKHGLNPLPGGGMVRVSAESSQEALRVIVMTRDAGSPHHAGPESASPISAVGSQLFTVRRRASRSGPMYRTASVP
jgi:LytS/YehU family sensor histidine kinase